MPRPALNPGNIAIGGVGGAGIVQLPSSGPAPGYRPGETFATPAAPAQGAPRTDTNTAQYDPYLKKNADRVDKRLDNFGESTGRAIDMATSKIRDASEGRRRALRGLLAGRGALGSTSSLEEGEGRIADREGQAVNAAAADISMGRERDYDNLLLGATGALGAPGDAAARDRRFNLDATMAAESSRRFDAQMARDDFYQTLNFALGGMSGAARSIFA